MCISGESCNLTIYVSQARGNAILQASLERRKQALHERRVALEQDVCLILLAYNLSAFMHPKYIRNHLLCAYLLHFVLLQPALDNCPHDIFKLQVPLFESLVLSMIALVCSLGVKVARAATGRKGS